MFNRANAALGANWSLHDLRHTAAYRMARDPQMPLTDVQWVLGPRPPVHHPALPEPGDRGRDRRGAGVSRPAPRPRSGDAASAGVPRREPADPLRRGRVVTAVDTSQVAAAVASPAAGSVKSTGAQLVAAFPPRPLAASWPATQARRSAVVDRVLSAPFALDNPRQPTQTGGWGCWRCWAGCVSSPATSWQQRWRASGAEDQPDWRLLVGTDRAKPLPHLTSGLLVLICADVIRPSLDWLLRFAPARHNLAPEMARTRDRGAFAELTALCQRPGRIAKPAAGADQRRDHHGRQGRQRRGGASRRLPRAARHRRAHAGRQRPARRTARCSISCCARTATWARTRPPRSRCSPAVDNPAASS